MHRLASLLILLIAPVLIAQETTSLAVKLQVQPAAAPTPALKYFLLPPVRDLKPGNAAYFYQRAHSPDWFRPVERAPWFDKTFEWLEPPASRIPEKEGRELLSHAGLFKEIGNAARCESCDWQLTSRIREEGGAMLVPDLQTMRVLGHLVALKARLETRDGQLGPALHTLQTGFAMARHLAECPLLVHALVGMAISHPMLGSVEEFIQKPGAPNLYWALRDLPDPFIDLRRPLQGDRMLMDGWLPHIRGVLNEPKFQPLPLDTLRAQVDKALGLPTGDNRADSATSIAMAYPKAIAYFRARGHSADELDALPVTQVVLMHALTEWDRWYDAIYRWHNVPYWQARAGLKINVDQRDRSLRRPPEGATFLVSQFLPAHETIFLVKARLQRRIAALQCVEALRLHAAANEGRFPEDLAEIRAVPIPLDPVFGKSFEYSSDGITARLYGAAHPGERETERTVLLYRITLTKKE